MKMQLIQQIEAELNKAKHADDEMFKRHMYAIETLARVAAGTSSQQQVVETPSKKHDITEAELKMMGAALTPKQNKAVTDDGFGNGDSLFDF